MKKDIENNIFFLSVLFLPIFQFVSFFLWILLLIFYIWKKEPLKFNVKLYWIYYLYFFLLFIPLLRSENILEELNYFVVKSPLLLFPILIYPLINDFFIKRLKQVWVLTCFSACSISFLRAVIRYLNGHSIDCFYYTGYTAYLHPTYFTILLNIGLLIMIEKLMSNSKAIIPSTSEGLTNINYLKSTNKIQNLLSWISEEYSSLSTRKKTYLNYSLTLLFMFNIYLLSARLSQLAVIFSLAFFIFLAAKKWGRLMKSIFLGLVIILSLCIISFNSRFAQFKDIKFNIEKVDTSQSDKSFYNSARVRTILIEAGIDIFKKHPLLGTSFSSMKKEFKDYLDAHKYYYVSKHYVGSHTQYLESVIILGIPGLLLLLYMFFGSVIRFLSRGNFLAAAFFLIFIINAFGEAVLSASGILFFCIWATVFDSGFTPKKE